MTIKHKYTNSTNAAYISGKGMDKSREYLACTEVSDRWFESLDEAEKWLIKQGYRPVKKGEVENWRNIEDLKDLPKTCGVSAQATKNNTKLDKHTKKQKRNCVSKVYIIAKTLLIV